MSNEIKDRPKSAITAGKRVVCSPKCLPKTVGARTPGALILGALILEAVACAPSMHPEIDKADSALSALEVDPAVQQHAPQALRDAESAVERAKRQWRRNADEDEAMHLSYLAGQRVAIAELEARAGIAEASEHVLHKQRQYVRDTAAQRDLLAARGEARAADERASDYRARIRSQDLTIAQLKGQLAEFEARETERGLQLTLSDVIFELDKAVLKPGARHKLAPLAAYLRQNPEARAEVGGHTDSLGATSYNKDLSRERAEAVKNLLVDMGAKRDRVSARGYGESRPRATNATEAGRQANRRVEIVVTTES